MRCSYVPLVALLITSGCYIGPRAVVPDAAGSPSGVEVRLQTTGGEVLAGELLALRPGAMVIRTTSPVRLAVVSLTLIREGSTPSGDRFGSRGPRGAALERFRLMSRYPQGIDETLEAALLREYGLSRMEVLAE